MTVVIATMQSLTNKQCRYNWIEIESIQWSGLVYDLPEAKKIIVLLSTRNIRVRLDSPKHYFCNKTDKLWTLMALKTPFLFWLFWPYE